MDIHKPKAAHSLREFAVEIGTIVCGILIALGLEQGIEAFHWAEKVRSAEERERPELVALYSWAQERSRVAGCIDRRADQLEKALMSGGAAWTPPPLMGLGRQGILVVPHRPWSDQVWRSLLADGTMPHLNPERQGSYSAVYSSAQKLAVETKTDADEVGALEVMRYPLSLSADKRAELIQRLEQERSRNFFLSVSARQVADGILKLVQLDKQEAETALLTTSNTYRACAGVGLLPPGAPTPLQLPTATQGLVDQALR
jgi:hypothetical protein